MSYWQIFILPVGIPVRLVEFNKFTSNNNLIFIYLVVVSPIQKQIYITPLYGVISAYTCTAAR